MTEDRHTHPQPPDQDQALDQLLASLAQFGPGPGFEDRVMSRVRVGAVPAVAPVARRTVVRTARAGSSRPRPTRTTDSTMSSISTGAARRIESATASTCFTTSRSVRTAARRCTSAPCRRPPRGGGREREQPAEPRAQAVLEHPPVIPRQLSHDFVPHPLESEAPSRQRRDGEHLARRHAAARPRVDWIVRAAGQHPSVTGRVVPARIAKRG